MSRAVTEALVDAAEVASILQPRDGVVEEQAVVGQPGLFVAAAGPMRSYERRVTTVEEGGPVRVRQEVEWRVDVPYFHWLFNFLFRFELRRLQPPDREGLPWWHPPQRIDRRAAGVLGVLGAVSIAFGYLNTLFSQTIAFAAEQFGSNDAAQGVAGSAVRLGGVLALILIASADRRGRRRMILISVVAGCIAAAGGVVAPSLAWLTASQVLARAFSGALLVVVGIAAAEEMPAGARAYAISVLALAAGFGAGICIAALRIADLGIGAWRVLYVVPLLALPFTRGIARRLPESRRYAAPHREVSLRGHGGRLLLLGLSGFLYNLYIAPASQFSNRFLRVERGYSGGGIALLALATGTPSGLAVVVGGRLADARGRRLIGATTLVIGTALDVAFYFTSGAPMWSLAFLSSLVFDASIPALAVYGPELFPTSLRGRANGIIAVTSLAGSALGLSLAGYLADRFDRIGPALAVVAVGPLLLAALVITRYPETAMRELEDLNPEDAPD